METETNTETIYATWCSVDPIRKKLDIYPQSISIRLENAYKDHNTRSSSHCVLGSDFFNATVHFSSNGLLYQTTPGMSMGRAGFKQPGYRSVERILTNNRDIVVSVYGKKVHGEWRITQNQSESDYIFSQTIPYNLWVETTNTITPVTTISNWKPEDIDSGALDKNVIVWQWCRGIPENQGDLTKLSEDWWVPYNYQNNETIEAAFKNGEYNVNHVDIELPVIGERKIEFIRNSCYAKQISLDGTKVRFIRRVIKTIQSVKEMFDKISVTPTDINIIIASLPEGSIPHHFNCPIFQDIMTNPVKTIDNHVYDRRAIETWFTYNNTSPLTGLPLSDKTLTPHTELKNEIDKFLKNLVTPSQSLNSQELEN